MMELGRLCIKIAGRDAGKKCVIVDVLDGSFVMIDGETRRRKCNVKHLEPLKETIKIPKGADTKTVAAEFSKLGIELKETKPKKAKPKQKQTRAVDRKKMAPKVEKKAKAPVKKSGAKQSESSAEGTELEKAIEGDTPEKKD